MMTGSCLCGRVRFHITKAVGPFEVCHCNRCRKFSGSYGIAALGVLEPDYTLIRGAEHIVTYEAPLLYDGPPYQTYFCRRCGCPTPPPKASDFFEIPAGLLDDDPGITPDKHIFVEFTPEWDEISDTLPQYTIRALYELRHGRSLPDDFEVRRHISPTDGSEER